jgi:hypothetical protein
MIWQKRVLILIPLLQPLQSEQQVEQVFGQVYMKELITTIFKQEMFEKNIWLIRIQRF